MVLHISDRALIDAQRAVCFLSCVGFNFGLGALFFLRWPVSFHCARRPSVSYPKCGARNSPHLGFRVFLCPPTEVAIPLPCCPFPPFLGHQLCQTASKVLPWLLTVTGGLTV
jgi:hypothetical protein